jgi:hypothetical protein
MRLTAALSGDLDQMLTEEVRIAEQAVTQSIREATEGLKTELRSQITSAGLGQRLANTWRGEVYPKGKLSIKAAGLVYSRAPEVVGAHDQGVTIRSKDGFWLAIPLPSAGKGPRGKRMTPGLWEKLRGQRLRFIYRRGKPSLLVAENQRARQGQRGGFSVASQKAQANGRGLVTVPMFLLVPQVTLKKKLDIDSASRRWVSTLAHRIANRFDEAERRSGANA